MNNTESTVISQYANSPTIDALIASLNSAIDPSEDIDNFYNYVFNIATAQGFGLDIWGRVVGVTRYALSDQYGNQITLTDDEYRTVILTKALSLISGTSIPSMNAILYYIFGSTGQIYVIDGFNMTITFFAAFTPNTLQLAYLKYFASICRPAGVGAYVYSISTPIFGFSQNQSSPTDATIGNFSSTDGFPFLNYISI